MVINNKNIAEFYIARSLVLDLLNSVKQRLNQESYKEIKLYLDNAEVEIAFECLFSDLITIDFFPYDKLDPLIYKSLSLLLELDKNNHMIADFWAVFVKFIDKVSSN